MSEILCITNRKLCREPFLTRLERIAAAHPAGIILREKDLPEPEYRALAQDVLALCRAYRVPCVLHAYPETALALEADGLHLPLPVLRTLTLEQQAAIPALGASCHSSDDAMEAQALGCTYLTAGHIFDTGCKPGLPGRGLEFLASVCRKTTLPVYAIGGIGPKNLPPVLATGAAGACIMHSLMTCPDPEALLHAL